MEKNINLKKRVLSKRESNRDRELKAITSGRSGMDCMHEELLVPRKFYRTQFGAESSYNLER